MEQNYVVYHLHDDKGSLLDSCTKWGADWTITLFSDDDL